MLTEFLVVEEYFTEIVNRSKVKKIAPAVPLRKLEAPFIIKVELLACHDGEVPFDTGGNVDRSYRFDLGQIFRLAAEDIEPPFSVQVYSFSSASHLGLPAFIYL